MKKTASIKIKLIVRFTVLFLILFGVVQGIVFYNFRRMSIVTSREKASSVAGLVRDTITSFMLLGVIQHRDIFLKNIQKTEGLKHIKILRGEPVIRQFGPPREMERATTPMEMGVLHSGVEAENLEETLENVDYTLIIPYRASTTGKINCMQCHHVQEGDVLGAVSITMDLTGERIVWLSTVSFMGIASLLFFVGTLYMIIVFFKPYTDFFGSLRRIFRGIEEGYLDETLDVKLNDEAGAVASGLNNMTERLSYTLSEIRQKVAMLIGHPFSSTGNALKDTAVMVDELVKIYRFKRAIENDTNKEEVYARIETILNEMHFHRYCIYEVHPSSRGLIRIISSQNGNGSGDNGSPKEEDTGWCSPGALERSEGCRARRTGTVVDSTGIPNICPNFTNEDGKNGEAGYCCIPVYIGGQVGGVIQLVHENGSREDGTTAIHYLKSYIQEAAPIIESKTYMEMLKEQSVVDKLTGLYNRRYLEEYVSTISAQVKRRNSRIGIVMMDIDYFKKVNDEFGHDVGDKVLQGIATIIRKALRESDILIRYGGEEVLALLMDIQEGTSMEIAEKIRKKVEDSTMVIGKFRLKRTVSIGVAEFPGFSEKFWQCLKYADIALYRAKSSGRNRVVLFRREMRDGIARQEAAKAGLMESGTGNGRH